ncbi:MAG TPA: NADH-quinone oxidoreductase subunit G [Marmoricola sp.]
MTTTPAKTDLITVTIDGVEIQVPAGTLVIRAAEQIGVQIPRFCDHPLLDPVGACRQCLVDVPDAGNGRPMPKPQASCTLPVAEGMVVNTQATSGVADKAQQGIMEFLLINHPLDCPVCDKGGECPLQNQAMSNGRGESRFSENGGVKRVYPKPINISAQILLDRERCVLCARCTRFSSQVAGDPFIELIERGALQQVGIYEKEPFESYFSGNTIQICPVGALTSADYRFRSRPFDLVSTPSVSEHDACGSAIRVDHRRGKVMRRLSGNEPEVNEEWITDKDRFAFTYSRMPDRLTHPQVRDEDSGELRPASWPEALAVAARGLAAAKGKVGVLTGGRLTAEDAYAYSKFARVALGTNDIDFRARRHSAEEAQFLAADVALSTSVTYADLETASSVLLVALDPEDEAGAIFLRLRKGNRKHHTPIWSVADHTSAGLRKMGGSLIAARPGSEAEVVAGLSANPDVALAETSVILVGDRAAEVPGLLAAVHELAKATGARLAWVPRRAGDRGAVEAGALPNLLPGGRPVTDAAARADLGAAWGVDKLPDSEGRDGDAIVAAAASGTLKALIVGGVDPADLAAPELMRKASAKAFVVALELRASDVTEVADVVFPVAPASDRSGSYVNWEGRVRTFGTVLHNPASLPEVRILAGIAEEMGVGLGIRTPEQAGAEMREIGPWDGDRPTTVTAATTKAPAATIVLASWKQSIDDGRMQDGEDYLRATARKPVVLASQSLLDGLGVSEGDPVDLTGPLGSVTLPVAVGDLAEGTVWAPASAPGASVRHLVGPAGSAVSIGVPGKQPVATDDGGAA